MLSVQTRSQLGWNYHLNTSGYFTMRYKLSISSLKSVISKSTKA